MKARIISQENHSVDKIYCDECKSELFLKSIVIKETNVKLKGKEYALIYFACNKCNHIYPILIKDDKYDELKQELENIKKRIQNQFNKHNVGLSEQLNKMAEIKAKRLKNHVSALNRKFPGTFTFVTSENNEQGQEIIYHE